MEKDFKELVKDLLVAEYGESKDSASELVKKHYKVVINALIKANSPDELSMMVRPCALAVCMAESKSNAEIV